MSVRAMLLAKAKTFQTLADHCESRFAETGSESTRIAMHEYRAQRDALMSVVEQIPDYKVTAEDTISKIREALKDPYGRASLQNSIDVQSAVSQCIWEYDQKEVNDG